MAKNDGIVNIHGKEYPTVALREERFRADHPKGRIISTEIPVTEEIVKFVTEIYFEGEELPISNGHAEEIRGSSPINTSSPLETCETSSVGRALVKAGYGILPTCSAEEVINAKAVQQQAEKLITKKQLDAIGAYLDERDDGDVIRDKILTKHGIDHLKELNRKLAAAAIKSWEIIV